MQFTNTIIMGLHIDADTVAIVEAEAGVFVPVSFVQMPPNSVTSIEFFGLVVSYYLGTKLTENDDHLHDDIMRRVAEFMYNGGAEKLTIAQSTLGLASNFFEFKTMDEIRDIIEQALNVQAHVLEMIGDDNDTEPDIN